MASQRPNRSQVTSEYHARSDSTNTRNRARRHPLLASASLVQLCFRGVFTNLRNDRILHNISVGETTPHSEAVRNKWFTRVAWNLVYDAQHRLETSRSALFNAVRFVATLPAGSLVMRWYMTYGTECAQIRLHMVTGRTPQPFAIEEKDRTPSAVNVLARPSTLNSRRSIDHRAVDQLCGLDDGASFHDQCSSLDTLLGALHITSGQTSLDSSLDALLEKFIYRSLDTYLKDR